MIKKINVSSSGQLEVINISSEVEEIVRSSGVKSGVCTVYVPHATAAIIVNENADPNISTDLLNALDKAIPLHAGYLHDKIDNNAAAHIKASIIGPSESIIIQDGKMMAGTWQDIMLMDFDGPRKRTILVKIIEG